MLCERKKYVPPKIEKDDLLTVPVKGKCNGKVINGTASFSMHGVVHLDFIDPQLKGTFIVPKLFLQIVSEMYDVGDDEEEISEGELKL